jgi:hypothetical protein
MKQNSFGNFILSKNNIIFVELANQLGLYSSHNQTFLFKRKIMKGNKLLVQKIWWKVLIKIHFPRVKSNQLILQKNLKIFFAKFSISQNWKNKINPCLH